MDRHAPKAPGVDKAELPARSQMQNAVRVRGTGVAGSATSSRPVMPRCTIHCRPVRTLAVRQIEDNVFAHTMDAVDAPAGQLLRHELRRRLEGLRLFAEPGGFDAVPAQALIDPAGDGFNLRQFRHG